MVTRLAILIGAVWTLLLCPGGAQAAPDPGCLDCHPVHYAERGSCIDCHRGDPRSTRQVIAHYGLIRARYAHFVFQDSPLAERGKKRIETSACRRCHVIGRRGNRLASDLDQSVQLSDPESLAKAIRHPVFFMPDFHFPEPILTEVINALLAAGQGSPPPATEVPRVVHFEERDATQENVFVKNCGACHRLLTEEAGGLGEGEVAPNLSGLLTEHFPRSHGKNEAWSRDSLAKWLENPRKSRPAARMAPRKLGEEDLRRLYHLLDEQISLPSSGE